MVAIHSRLTITAMTSKAAGQERRQFGLAAPLRVKLCELSYAS